MAGFVPVVQRGENAELVTAKTRHYILAPGRRLDIAGNDLEQFVASVMTKAVVDALEVVDVEEHDRQHALVGGLFDQSLGKNLVEAAAVDQVGQGIVMGRLLQRYPGLIQLTEQQVDPAQVMLLALQLLVG
ncbi:hypothetical protein D3C80_1320700 [compost metagenome]